MNFSEYISADRTFFFDAFRVVTKTTAMMIFTPERLFTEPRGQHVRVLACIRTHARRILTLVITPGHGLTFNAYPPLAGKMRFAEAL